MTALIVVVLLIVLTLSREFIRALLRPSPPLREPFADPVLGTLTPCDGGWTANIVRGEDSFQLEIAGGRKPDAATLAHARYIVNEYPSFKKMIIDRMESESRDYPPNAKAELAELEIDHISLSGPGEGMIFFRGTPTDVGIWRFDYIAGEPTGLGCDT